MQHHQLLSLRFIFRQRLQHHFQVLNEYVMYFNQTDGNGMLKGKMECNYFKVDTFQLDATWTELRDVQSACKIGLMQWTYTKKRTLFAVTWIQIFSSRWKCKTERGKSEHRRKWAKRSYLPFEMLNVFLITRFSLNFSFKFRFMELRPTNYYN